MCMSIVCVVIVQTVHSMNASENTILKRKEQAQAMLTFKTENTNFVFGNQNIIKKETISLN